MSKTIYPTAGGSCFCFRHETAIESEGGQISKGADGITLSILPPYASGDDEEYLQLTLQEAAQLIEQLAHLIATPDETLPETDENGIPLFANPIEKSLYE